jgi:hypothetical protein
MKFDYHDYWKHENNVDAFFKVVNVASDDDGETAKLHGHWFVQGTEGYWEASHQECIFISPEHYDKWHAYKPKGDRRLI